MANLGERPLLGLGERHFGECITDHRSSWVRRINTRVDSYFVKTYDYCTCADRWRGAGRTTGPWNWSRAAREFDALEWMIAHGLPAPIPIAAFEDRRFGFVRRATLITRAFGGQRVDVLLPQMPETERVLLADAIGTLVGGLHKLGFRDRNLDLRNLLAERTPDGTWLVAKIDSPRHCLRRPGAKADRLVRADWARLLPQLAPFSLDLRTRAAAQRTRT